MLDYKIEGSNIYYNAYSSNLTNDNKIAEYSSTSVIPIVNNPSNYYLKIENFEISNLLLPMMIIKNDSLSITIDNGISYNRQYLIPINESNNPENYGFIYNVSTFQEMINKALLAAHTALGVVGNPPFIEYDWGKGLFLFAIDLLYPTNNVTIWFNTGLEQKLNSFRLFNNGYSEETTSGKVYRLVVDPSPLNVVTQYPFPGISPAVPLTYDMVILYQPYPSLFLLFEVNKLLITTDVLPTAKEYLSTPLGSTNIARLGVLFTVPVNPSYSLLSQKIDYRETGNVKLIDLLTTYPITSIGYKIYFQKLTGEIYPVYIEPGKGFGIVFGFIHKSIYDNEYTYIQ